MSFLDLSGKTFLVVGFANKKSIAWSVSRLLVEEGARVIYSVRNDRRKEELESLLNDESTVLTCDFEQQEEI
ncbi:MAG: SDR family oxidoreductase, partial [Verrucomicrobiota bacterium]|nr:SDR family oxidoreductase [Verrucomicrobiota bacterium]